MMLSTTSSGCFIRRYRNMRMSCYQTCSPPQLVYDFLQVHSRSLTLDPQRLSTQSPALFGIAPSRDWPNRFAESVLKQLPSVVSSLLVEIPRGVSPRKIHGGLVSIGIEAYKWNSSVKSAFKYVQSTSRVPTRSVLRRWHYT